MSDICSTTDICPASVDDDFDLVIENSCRTSFFKCKWIVKDFSKHPYENIASPGFEVSDGGYCEFTLENFTNDKKNPELNVKFYCSTYSIVTFDVSFSDCNGELFYNMKKTSEFSPPNRSGLYMPDFPRKKILELPEDTMVIKFEMKISRPQSSVLTPKDAEK